MINREEFIERLAAKGYTKRDSAAIIDDFTSTIMEAMAEGESVMFRGFGSFEVKQRSPRVTIDIQTGKPVDVPALKAPHFSAGKQLKRAVREGKIPE